MNDTSPTPPRRGWRKPKTVLLAAGLIALLAAAFFVYVGDYYRAEPWALPVVSGGNDWLDGVTVVQGDGYTLFTAARDFSRAAVFYPGGKVEAAAYAPLLHQLAAAGLSCVLAEMPFNLAVFDPHAADRVRAAFPLVEDWYLMGHSLGGVMAAQEAAAHPGVYRGLVLLAAYPTQTTDLPTLAVYGSRDLVLDASRLDLVENIYVIEGGNHAQFGNYGAQQGDGVPTVTGPEQQELTVRATLDFVARDEAENGAPATEAGC